MKISIIIPVFNEEQNIGRLLEYLLKHNKGFIAEIIVVDGGSLDQTIAITRQFSSVKIIFSEKSRAKQMNAGARIAKAEILYFLHADSYPPFHFDNYIIRTIKNDKKAGCFIMKFDKNHWWLKLMAQFTRINHRSCRGGDQSLFIKEELFFKLGGYNENYIVYEDNELIGKLYDLGEFTIINKWLTTSARLYEKLGVWQTQWLFCQIYWKKFKGASPEQLYSCYQSKVNSST
ncbi:TIGR04283 family arsenosugar biosynthesis glycosyltransferase [Zunongwangia sp. HGR-M22]|uniref:TIGR04283 family arsenosugar biosynthesis glycosyltransferase n=1 Tax=Zunongwangia sp. HGR-M22 TaxID=3015168 RepID=UPI0022DE31DE|nr:TIGR04283 family arsenosugar biosynthesis glycosyltransferase [Zunongwangia sp. HGR-M22]WBL25240.1 TIGR04283 family arsenosugar biosynthesis glycosyltransferase [Zunongwangia sp. HGR-M22]